MLYTDHIEQGNKYVLGKEGWSLGKANHIQLRITVTVNLGFESKQQLDKKRSPRLRPTGARKVLEAAKLSK